MSKLWLPSYRLFTETMLKMMRMTTPNGCEPYVWAHLPTPPRGAAPNSPQTYRNGSYYVDDHGNYHVILGNSRTMWTSHCDTADSTPEPVTFKWDGDWLYTDGRSILGADDKTGCTIMSMMIRAGVPGHYVFFAGEEVGCLGSKALADEIDAGAYDHVVSFDRKGESSIITHQMGSRCCSDEWASELGRRINQIDSQISLMPDSTGLYTDSREFVDLASECTNISVGYLNQHTQRERQNVRFAYNLCIAMIKLCRDGRGLPDPVRSPLDLTEEDEYDLWSRAHANKTSWRRLDPDYMSEDVWRNELDTIDGTSAHRPGEYT